MKYQLERSFDEILNDAIPLILFSEEGVRNPLINELRSLYTYFEGDNQAEFEKLLEEISKRISNRKPLPSDRENRLGYFIRRRMSYDNLIADLQERLGKLERKKPVEVSPVKTRVLRTESRRTETGELSRTDKVLLFILEKGDIFVKDIPSFAIKNKKSIGGVMNSMIKKGFIEKPPGTGRGVSYRIHLSPEGTKRAKELKKEAE